VDFAKSGAYGKSIHIDLAAKNCRLGLTVFVLLGDK